MTTALTQARQLASAHGCMVIERGGKYLVFRKTAARPVLVGARSTPETLRAFVRRVTTAN